MKSCINFNWMFRVVLLTLTTSAAAHMGNRLYPIPEVSDEMLERIRFDDESVEEWYELVGEPTMSLIDFQYNNTDLPDPSSLDFRIWIAWHDDPVRIYLAFSASDDVHIKTNPNGWGSDIEITLAVDADHSGQDGYSDLSFEEAEGSWGGAQQYRAFSQMDSGEPTLYSLYTSSSNFGSGYVLDGSGDLDRPASLWRRSQSCRWGKPDHPELTSLHTTVGVDTTAVLKR